VAKLVEALRYKPEGRGFDSRWCHWNFSLTYSFQSQCGPGVDSVFNRNKHKEYFLEGKGGKVIAFKISLVVLMVLTFNFTDFNYRKLAFLREKIIYILYKYSVGTS
jgi:hypothetical protein